MNYENQTLKQNPYCMGVICNIQTMSEKVYKNYDKLNEFKRLETFTYDELFKIQDILIKIYNRTVK